MPLTAADLVAQLLARDCGTLCLDDADDREMVARWILGFMESVSESDKPLATFRFADPPPSANKIYTVSRGRKILTAAARKWKNRFVTSKGGAHFLELASLDLSIHDRFHLDIWVYLDESEIENLRFGEDKRTKYPYAKVDTSNFFKLAEDSVSELLGITCDRQNFDISAHKRVADDRGRRIVIHLLPYQPQDDPLDRNPSVG